MTAVRGSRRVGGGRPAAKVRPIERRAVGRRMLPLSVRRAGDGGGPAYSRGSGGGGGGALVRRSAGDVAC